MFANKTIAVVVPSYNEETQISMVIDTMPAFVDRIVIVNDGSKDRTESIVQDYIARGCPSDVQLDWVKIHYTDSPYDRADKCLAELREAENAYYPKHTVYNDNATDRIVLITEENSGVGAAIAMGYKWCRDHGIDCTAVMAGDAQMDPAELESIVSPVCCDKVDYVKGNRLSHGAASVVVPSTRRFGNSVLSLMTKVASGYWRVFDTQTGYTAISLHALECIPLYKIYPRYGCPNDILIKLNIANCTIREVPIKPVYAVGEHSKMKIAKVAPRIFWLLVKGFFYRIWIKYFKLSFHPVFLFYMAGLLMLLINIPFFIKILIDVIICGGHVTTGIYMAFLLLTIFSFQSISFGMWMDIQDNESLNR